MADIQVGDLVQCNIENADPAWPEEKRTMFGYIVNPLPDAEKPECFEVATLSQNSPFFRGVFYAVKDVKPLAEPMSEYAQKTLLRMARLFKSQGDRALNQLKRITAITKE